MIYDSVGYETPFVFHWTLLDKCQFNCSYCYMENKNLYTDNTWKLVLFKLKAVNEFSIDILGGEPMLHPHINEIVSKLNDMNNCLKINIISNFYEDNISFDKLKYDKVKIHMSFHPEYKIPHNKILKFNQTHAFEVDIQMHPDEKYWDSIEDMILFCQNHKIMYSVNLLHSTKTFKVLYNTQFYERFNKYIKNEIANVTHTTGSITEVKSAIDIRLEKIDYKNSICSAKMYDINISGKIKNLCTNQNLSQYGPVCCHWVCSCDDMFYFKKVKYE